MKTILVCVRLAVADALGLVAVVFGGIFGAVALIFGLPREWADCCEQLHLVAIYGEIVALVAVLMFFAHWQRRDQKDAENVRKSSESKNSSLH